MSPEEQERIVGELEVALERLQALYNQYFMGIEKLEPTVQRKDVERKINALRREQIRNTAVRFRVQTQIQKFNTQSTYWRRICRQIEEGTYQRDIMRARKRTDFRDEAAVASKALAQLDGEPAAAVPTGGADIGLDDPFGDSEAAAAEPSEGFDNLDDPFSEGGRGAPAGERSASPKEEASGRGPGFDPDKTPLPDKPIAEERLGKKPAAEDEAEDLSAFFSRPSVPPPPPPRPGTPPPPPGSGPKPRPRPPAPKTRAASAPEPPAAGPSKDRMKSIYRAYVTARKKCNEPTENISFDKVSKLLEKQIAAKGEGTDFKVVIRKGKAVIKTVKK